MFAYSKKDAYPVIFTTIVAILPFIIATMDTMWWVIMLPIQLLMMFIVTSATMHHQVHWKAFKNNRFNKIYENILSAVSCIPFHGWVWFHTQHHRITNDVPINGKVYDPLSIYRYGNNGQRENFWQYCFVGSWRGFNGKLAHDETCAVRLNQYGDNIRLELRYMIVYTMCILLYNVWYGLLYLSMCVINTILNQADNYGTHWGSASSSDTRRNAVSSYDWWYNFIGFNAGYHQEHHSIPSVHWTQLPDITKTLPHDRKIISGMFIFNAPPNDNLNFNKVVRKE